MSVSLQKNVSLAPYSTLQMGGVAEYFADIFTKEDLIDAVAFAKKEHLPITILGGGSNVLIADVGITGLVVRMQMSGIEVQHVGSEVLVTAMAGEVLDDLIAYCVQKEYWGLENLSHIPGTVGAAPVQNVGAYGVEVCDVIQEVRVYDTDTLTYHTLTADECQFGYRDSVFKKDAGNKYIVCAVTFRLKTVPTPILSYRDLQEHFADRTPSQQEVRDAIIAIRANKFPDWHKVGTAGSFFKNPIISVQEFKKLQQRFADIPSYPVENGWVKVPLGWVLDKILHLKNVSTGAVQVYKNQALVIINTGGATASDISHFADTVTKEVREKTGMEVQWEVTKLGVWR